MNKKRVFNVGVVTMLIIAAILGMGYVAVISGAVFSLMPNPPKPEIAYGEFPFRLTYELNGEIITVEDMAICEFDGYGERSTAGQSRKWKTYLKSRVAGLIPTNEKGRETGFAWITLLDLRNDDVFDDFGHKVLELYFFGGNGHYYMGDDLGNHDRDAQGFNYVSYHYQNADGTTGGSSYKPDVAFERFGIKLISWEPSSPIVNTFK